MRWLELWLQPPCVNLSHLAIVAHQLPCLIPTPDPRPPTCAAQSIWRAVSEDFAPWSVDVTTEDPGVAGLSKSNASDATFGIRVVIDGGRCQDWWSAGNCGGVAYLGSFNWSTDTPCFVFAASLGSISKYVWEAISHEVSLDPEIY
jgi:hypothetical protein